MCSVRSLEPPVWVSLIGAWKSARRMDDTGSMTEKLAEQGWMVRHAFMEAASKPAIRFFACGFDTNKEAESAVRQYPGVEQEDKVDAVRRLSKAELTGLEIKAGMIKACT